jgi:hypothetical protein
MHGGCVCIGGCIAPTARAATAAAVATTTAAAAPAAVAAAAAPTTTPAVEVAARSLLLRVPEPCLHDLLLREGTPASAAAVSMRWTTQDA